MSKQIKIKVGPSGNSESFYAQGFTSTQDAFSWQRKRFGLDAFELPFGRGVRLSSETAQAIALAACENGVTLSAHAPYYVNLANPDPAMAEKSMNYILETARVLHQMGGERVVVHVGSPKNFPRETAMDLCAQRLLAVREALIDEGMRDIKLCLETMGRPSVLGSLEEILFLVNLDESFLPCVDFAHLHAVTQGMMNSSQAFEDTLDVVEKALGLERARLMHMHFSRIEFGKKGEIRHRTFAETDYGPDFDHLAPLLVERGYQGTLICESQGTMAEDAALMRNTLLAYSA